MYYDDWICIEDDEDEDDYVIERFELRIQGRKPLVLNTPSYSQLLVNVQQYLHITPA